MTVLSTPYRAENNKGVANQQGSFAIKKAHNIHAKVFLVMML